MFSGSLLSNKIISNNFLPFPLRDCILCFIDIKLGNVACFGQWNVNRWPIVGFSHCGILSFPFSLFPKISMLHIGWGYFFVQGFRMKKTWSRVEPTSEGRVMGARN